MLSPAEEEARGALTRLIAELGHAPSLSDLARELDGSAAEVEQALARLAQEHALLLHPETNKPWVVHPFALSPGSCWVQTPQMGYWANCLYCACGIAAALKSDAAIHTRYGGEAEPVRFEVRDGALVDTGDVFHLSTPVARWWDNVIFACSSFQPFRNERDVDSWCARHDLPKGAVMSLSRLWRFADDWYGSYLQRPWKKRSPAEARDLFARHGLTGRFWSLD